MADTDSKPTAAERRAAGYHEFTWQGHARYHCNDCAYDSSDRDAVIKHSGAQHADREHRA